MPKFSEIFFQKLRESIICAYSKVSRRFFDALFFSIISVFGMMTQSFVSQRRARGPNAIDDSFDESLLE